MQTLETKNLTKYQARQSIYTWMWVREELENKDLNYLERESSTYNEKYDNIKKENNQFLYIRNSEGTTYIFTIDTKHSDNLDVFDKVKINEETYSIGFLIKYLGDLTAPEQEKALQQLDIQSIEKYLEKRCGCPITFKKEIFLNRRNEWQMNLTTDNLLDKSGVCKSMLKEIHIECIGIGYSVNKFTGEQFLWIPSFDFQYEHQTGGHNGHEMGRVRFNPDTKRFEGLNYETEKYEVI